MACYFSFYLTQKTKRPTLAGFNEQYICETDVGELVVGYDRSLGRDIGVQHFWLFEERIGLPVVSYLEMNSSPGTYGGAIYVTIDDTEGDKTLETIQRKSTFYN
jgi:hypothetical protein